MQLFTTRYAKFWTAILGTIAQLVAAGIFPEEWGQWANALVALLTAIGVVAIPNTSPDGVADPRYSEQG